LSDQLQSRNIRALKLNVPLGRSETEIWQVVSLLSGQVNRGSEVILDITYAFRHLPLLMLTSLAYLAGQRDVKVKGVYYGAYEARTGNRVPIFDLTSFLTLTDCYHAIRQFRETGDARRLAAYLKQLNATLWKQAVGSKDLSALVGSLESLSAAMVTPLPIEAGLHSRSCLRHVKSALNHIGSQDFVAHSLLNALVPSLELLAVDNVVGHKRALPLNMSELRRQLQAIRFAVDAQAPDRALLLLREWIVSRCLLAENLSAGWLDYRKNRDRMSRTLSAIAQRIQADRDSVPDTMQKLSSLWEKIAARRNKFAHAGMNEESEVRPESERESIARLAKECEARCEEDHLWQVGFCAAGARLLVTPLGLSPGVLYTALTTCPADSVLVISSDEAAGRLAEVCEKAGCEPSKLKLEIVDDPHRCFAIADRLLPRVRPLLLQAAEVTLNVTGGTTAMQYIVERIGREAARLGVPVRRIALVDARPYPEQQDNPYVAGDLIVLDENEAGRGE
jgi:CRISPR-associated DxTHG motif protein